MWTKVTQVSDATHIPLVYNNYQRFYTSLYIYWEEFGTPTHLLCKRKLPNSL